MITPEIVRKNGEELTHPRFVRLGRKLIAIAEAWQKDVAKIAYLEALLTRSQTPRPIDYELNLHCQDPNHNPPAALFFSSTYVHQCPGCGVAQIIESSK